jgi:hypothetical protein
VWCDVRKWEGWEGTYRHVGNYVWVSLMRGIASVPLVISSLYSAGQYSLQWCVALLKWKLPRPSWLGLHDHVNCCGVEHDSSPFLLEPMASTHVLFIYVGEAGTGFL